MIPEGIRIAYWAVFASLETVGVISTVVNFCIWVDAEHYHHRTRVRAAARNLLISIGVFAGAWIWPLALPVALAGVSLAAWRDVTDDEQQRRLSRKDRKALRSEQSRIALEQAIKRAEREAGIAS